ncbi:MAG: hypothetical protein FJZ87_10295 [Chloroflexi bacterium]|nr:hypothetical protein [Chloroflexota bacterium]
MKKLNPAKPSGTHKTRLPELEDEVVVKFLKILENIRSEEMSCEEMYSHLDEFVEREVRLHDASKVMPLIREHLDLCPECCDEYDALLNVLEKASN